MHLFRIAKTSYIRDLSGTGAKRYGGRWNHKGVAMLYASQHRSLAILEFLVHASMQALPTDLSFLTLEVPDSSKTPEVDLSDLPSNWRDYPAPFRLAELGSEWIASGNSLLLKVPSVVVPEEWNILINPIHPDFEAMTINSISSFSLDSRFSVKPKNPI